MFSIANELGQEVNVKPSKIVAGSEADKTNELLQALAILLENKQSNNKTTKNSNIKKNGDSSTTPIKGTKTSNGTNNKKVPVQAVAKTSKEAAVAVKKPAAVKAKPAAKPTTNGIVNKPVVKLESTITPIDENKKDSITPTKKSSASLSSRKKSARDKSPVPIPGPELNSTLQEEEPVKDIVTATQFEINSAPQMSPDLASTDSGITVEHPPSAPMNVNHTF